MTEGQVRYGPRNPLAGEARRDADVAAYRDAVTGLLTELVGPSRYLTVETAERLLNRRLREPVFTAVFSALPKGPDAAIRRVISEVRSYRQSPCSSAENLPAMIRIALLAQIDLLWWGHLREYQTDAHVFGARELLHLEPLRHGQHAALPVPAADDVAARPGRALGRAAGRAGPGPAHGGPAVPVRAGRNSSSCSTRSPRSSPRSRRAARRPCG